MKIVRLDSTDSTNSWIARNESSLSSPTLVYCNDQTAGRGQKGNSWESEPGKNITASLYFIPKDFLAVRQFEISEALALAIVGFLKEKGVDPMIKWPNDIYVGDQKICGILIEHVVTGKNITRTIAGFGININQTKFLSDAPNPVSLRQLTGRDFNIDECVNSLIIHLNKFLDALNISTHLHQNFLDSLWRKDGNFHSFFDRRNNEQILARIHDVETDGSLLLSTSSGEKRKFFFKEVEFILPLNSRNKISNLKYPVDNEYING